MSSQSQQQQDAINALEKIYRLIKTDEQTKEQTKKQTVERKQLWICLPASLKTGDQLFEYLGDLFGPDNITPIFEFPGLLRCSYHQQFLVRGDTFEFVVRMINPSVNGYAIDQTRYNQMKWCLYFIKVGFDSFAWIDDCNYGKSLDEPPTKNYGFFLDNPGIDLEKFQEHFDVLLNDPPPIKRDFSNLKGPQKPSMLGSVLDWFNKQMQKTVPGPLPPSLQDKWKATIEQIGDKKNIGIIQGLVGIGELGENTENVKVLNTGTRFEDIPSITRGYRNNDAIIILPQKNVADYKMWHEEFEILLSETHIPIYIMDFHLSEETKKFVQDEKLQLI